MEQAFPFPAQKYDFHLRFFFLFHTHITWVVSHVSNLLQNSTQNLSSTEVESQICVYTFLIATEKIMESLEFPFFFWNTIPPPLAQQPNAGQGHLILEVSRSTQWHATVGMTPLDEGSAQRRDLYLTIHHSQDTDIHAPGGIRIRNPNKRPAV
jgi:hypothetical protein